MQPTQQAPPSPVKGLGYVGGSTGAGSGLNGYVGEKPATREEPQNPQSLRRNTNLASPDPAMSNSAFTQSQFTTNISAGALQSQAMRTAGANGPYGTGGNSSTEIGTPQSAEDKRRENLRRYKESSGGRAGGGGSCGFTPHPSFNNRTQAPPVNSRGPMAGNGQIARNTMPQTQTASVTTSSEPSGPTEPKAPESTFIAYTLADPGSMYKAFSGSTTWFRVLHLIVPEGKKAKRVHLASMLVSKKSEDSSNSNASDVYSLRLVRQGSDSPLYARYDCDNTDTFQVFTMDLTNTDKSATGLLEVQAQNSQGMPILFSSAILEF